jgi:dodecin
MAGESTYQIIELVGTSKTSWEEAAKNAVEAAEESLIDPRIAEVVKLDMVVEDGKVSAYRAKINLSFRYHEEDDLRSTLNVLFFKYEK